MQARAEEQRLRVEKQKAEREDRDRERKAKAEQARVDKERLEMERLARREAEAAEQVPSVAASNSASPLSRLVPQVPVLSSPVGLCQHKAQRQTAVCANAVAMTTVVTKKTQRDEKAVLP